MQSLHYIIYFDTFTIPARNRPRVLQCGHIYVLSQTMWNALRRKKCYIYTYSRLRFNKCAAACSSNAYDIYTGATIGTAARTTTILLSLLSLLISDKHCTWQHYRADKKRKKKHKTCVKVYIRENINKYMRRSRGCIYSIRRAASVSLYLILCAYTGFQTSLADK